LKLVQRLIYNRVFENSEKNREKGNEKGTKKGKTSKSGTNRPLTTKNVMGSGKEREKAGKNGMTNMASRTPKKKERFNCSKRQVSSSDRILQLNRRHQQVRFSLCQSQGSTGNDKQTKQGRLRLQITDGITVDTSKTAIHSNGKQILHIQSVFVNPFKLRRRLIHPPPPMCIIIVLNTTQL